MVRRNRNQILVIEDDRDIAGLIELHLREASFEVRVAHDGLSGLEKASADDCDLVVLDLALPGMEGLEICRRLRA